MQLTKKAISNEYRLYKAYAEDTAIKWQNDFHNHNYSYGELAYFQDYFTRLAKRYGLTKVFRENGII